jgi:hypothetical protein
VLGDGRKGRETVGALAHDLHLFVCREQTPHTLARERLVVNNQGAKFAHAET